MSLSQRRRSRLTALVAAMGLAGCATTGGGPGGSSAGLGSIQKTFADTFANDDPCSNNARNIGIAAGVIGGAVLAKVFDAKTGSALGVAAAGALVGGLIGNDIDRKRCELSKIAKQYDLDMQFVPVAVSAQDNKDGSKAQAYSMTLRDGLGDGAQFLSNSDQLTPRARAYFLAIAQQYSSTAQPAGSSKEQLKEWQKTMQERRLLLIGHTDDTGDSQLNASLSERRARAVATLLQQNGVPKEQLYFQGAGEGYPVASNETEQGRAQNRRVEFVEVYSETALAYYIDNRRPDYALYRPVVSGAAFSAEGKTAARQVVAKKAAVRSGGAAAAAGNSRGAAKAAAAKPGPQNSVAQATSGASGVATLDAAGTHAAPTAAAEGAASATVSPRPANAIDFGGERLSSSTRLVSLGKPAEQKSGGMSFISSAHASNDAPFIARCDQDRYRKIGDVKALSGKEYRTSDYLKGLHGTSWAQMINGNLVVLHKVAVLRDASVPSMPELKFYADYDSRKSKSAKPLWSGNPNVNAYQGSNGLLYRIFANSQQGAQCMDILFPSGGGFAASDGKLIYGNVGQLYAADFQPQKQP